MIWSRLVAGVVTIVLFPGNRVAYWRRIKGFTQAGVAQRLRIARETVARWENGTQVPGDEAALALARLLRTTVGELFPRGTFDRHA